MTLSELITDAYGWLDARALGVLAVCAAVPVGGTALAWLGRRGPGGRLMANAVLAFGMIAFVLSMLAVIIARWAFGVTVLEANVVLLLGPVVALLLAVLGARLVFPLSELGSARTARDIGLFILLILGIIWFFSQFRGWGVLFFGGLAQLAVIGIFVVVLVRRLYKRAFRPGSTREGS